ncbi:helix-turn-helix domain-containing protein [Vibrio fluvialis]|uniref:helix-turn-helix domain-containing protein n=1 Tax=Vibrio fluvialis TaxID=676 RepID=UPI003BAD95BF
MHEEFKRLQEKSGLSGRALAEWLGVDYATVKRYRNGESDVPTPTIIAMSYLVKYGPDYSGV